MSKYDDERKRILEKMQSKNVTFGASSSSSSKYDEERRNIKNGVVSEAARFIGPSEVSPEASSNRIKVEADKKIQAAGTKKMLEGAKMTYGDNAKRTIAFGNEVQAKAKAQEDARKASLTPYENWYEKNVSNSFVGKALGSLQGADRAASNIKAGALDTASLGLTQGIGRAAINNIPGGRENLTPQFDQRRESTAYKAGEFAGYIAPGVAADRIVARVGGAALRKLPSIAQGLLRGGASGALDMAAQESGDVAFRQGQFDPLNVALGAGLGGALGGAIPAIGALYRNYIKRGSSAAANAATQAAPEQLMLPSSTARSSPIKVTGRPIETPDVIYGQGKADPLGLPEAKLSDPTVGRLETRVNPYVAKLENLFETARKLDMPPGREREYLEDVWSRMASREDPGLDELIELAYPPIKPSKITSNLVQRAKGRQETLDAYGVPLPAKRIGERYDGGIKGVAANPAERVGRAPIINTVQPPKLVDAAIPSRPRVDVTPPEKLQGIKTSRPKEVDDVEEILEAVKQPRVRDRVVSFLDEQEKAALERIASRKNRLSSNPIDEWADHAIVMASQLGKGTIKATDFTEELVKRFGEAARPYAAAIYQQSKEILKKQERRAAEEVKASGGRDLQTTQGQIVNKPIRSSIIGSVETAKAAGRNVYQNQVDMYEPLKTISKDTYDTAMDANRSNQIANTIVSDKFVNPQGEVIGEGLQEIIRKAGRGNYNKFTDYLIARHAVTRMSRGERVYADKLNMTNESIAARVKELESQNPNFKDMGKEWDTYYRNIRTVYGVEEGLIPKALADVLEKQNPNYAPMYRQFSASEKIKGMRGGGAKPMFSGQKAPLKEVSSTGSTRKVVDPVRSTIEQTGAWVNAAMRNRTMQSIVKKINEDPAAMKEIAEIVQPPKGNPNLREILENDGEDKFLEMLQSDFDQLFKRQSLDNDMIMRAMVKGEPVHVKVKNPEAVKALMGMGSDSANIVIDVLTNLSKAIKFGATGPLAPMFATKSIGMDVGQALVQADNPAKQLGYAIGSVFSSVGKEFKIPGLQNMARDYYRSGGGYSAVLRGERGLKTGIGKMKTEPLLSPKGIVKGLGNTVALPVKTLYTISDVSENIQRIAAFHAKLKQLGGDRTPGNIREAMNASREITVNYSRKGLQSKNMEALFPYHNAAVQGMYRFVKAWKKNTVKTAAMVTLTVIIPKMLEFSKFNEDKDYQKLPARERFRNIIISKNKDGTFNKIPMSPEYNAIGALAADALEYEKFKDPGTFKGVADALVNSYTPPIVSGALMGATQGGGIDQSLGGVANSMSISPFAAVFGNKSFTGGPIESLKVTDRSPKYRYDERTSSVAKYIGEKLKYSPLKTDYLIRAYGGDAARLLLPLTSDTGAGTPRNTLLKNFIVDPVFSNNLTDDYYYGKLKITQAYRDSEEVEAEIPKWLNEDLREFVTSTSKDSTTTQLKDLNAEKKAVQTNDKLSAKEKAEEIRELQREINEIYLDVNSRMEEAGVPLPRR